MELLCLGPDQEVITLGGVAHWRSGGKAVVSLLPQNAIQIMARSSHPREQDWEEGL